MPADGSSALVAGAPDVRLWLGPEPHEGTAAYTRARAAGMTATRALVVGEIGSFPDCWKFQKTIARVIGASLRTVQRAIAQAKALGLIRVHRCKKGEIPPKADNPIPCGWSHRWAVGRGRAAAAVQAAIAAARLRFASALTLRPTRARLRGVTAKSSPSTATPAPVLIDQAKIDRELAELAPHLSERVRLELERRYKRKPRDGPED